LSEHVEDRIERVYREQGTRLWRALVAHIGDPDVAEDVVAEAFAQAIRRGDAIQDPPAWIWRTAFRIAMGVMDDRKRTGELSEVAGYEMPEPALELMQALRALGSKQRASLILHHYAGYRAREIAEMIGSTPGADYEDLAHNVGREVAAPPEGTVATWAWFRGPNLVDVRIVDDGPEAQTYREAEGTFVPGETPPWAPPCS
jgi:RNA polymerase sigma-70 factor (ECF subfamily)